MSVSINSLRDGVIVALKSAYPSVKVYGEEIKQGLVGPCFFVKILTAEQDREVDRRYLRQHSFDVHYFSKTNEDMHNVAEILYASLEYISADGKLYRGQRMRNEIVDGVLHFFVDYDFHVIKPKQVDPKMQTMQQKEMVKDG